MTEHQSIRRHRYDDVCGCNDCQIERLRADIPGHPPIATVVDGCVVHGDKPLTEAGVAAVRELIAATRRALDDKQ